MSSIGAGVASYLAYTALLAGSASTLLGGTFYVATNGSDGNPGSADRPWSTIQKAADMLQAGDTAIVRNGNYPEVVQTRANGTPLARITFQAESADTKVIAFTVKHSFQRIAGFTITGDSPQIYASICIDTGGDYLDVISNTFQGSAVGVYQLYAYAYASNVVNLNAAGNSFLNGWQHAVNLYSGGNHVISSNLFSSPNGYDAIRIGATNVVIRGNTFTNWSNIPLQSGSLKVGVIYYFTAVGGNPDFSNVGAGPAPYSIGEAHYFKATGTTPVNWGAAVVENANHPDIIQAFQTGAVGTIPPDYASWNLVFENNLVVDCHGDVQLGNITDGGNFGNLRDWTFRNNVIARIDRTLNLFAPGFTFYNNTFYIAEYTIGSVVNCGVGPTGNARGVKFYNNIMCECALADRTNVGWYDVSDIPTAIADYNLVVGTGPGTIKGAGWTANGNEAHGINGRDPLFVNASANDFRLMAGSPAVGAGTNLSAIFTTDFAGRVRGSKWDMGAYQHSADTTGAAPAKPTGLAVIRVN